MKYHIVPNSCRVCLKRDKKLRSIYKPLEDGDEPPNEMLRQITGIAIEKSTDTNELPVNICKDCVLSLNLAYEFRTKALKSNAIIESFLGRRQSPDGDFNTTKSYDVKVEDFKIHFSDEAKIEYLDENFDNMYTTTDDEPLASVQQNINSDAGDNSLDSDPIVINNTNSIEAIKNLEGPRRTLVRTRTNRGRKRIYDIPLEDDHDVDISASKEVEKSKGNDGAGYICDVCGNIYSKRFRMMEHRQSHNMKTRHECELCGKGFHLREKLRKHMYAHKDKRPHKCSFCSRTFFFESLKRTHEAIHQGAKPHICEICNKAFAYSQALKNHKLIHAEIKLFHCEYCNKDFRLQHHMKQHEETKLHQNAVRSIKTEENDDI